MQINMLIINEERSLLEITGGLKLSGAVINAFVSSVKIIYEIGQALGSSIRRTKDKKLCPL